MNEPAAGVLPTPPGGQVIVLTGPPGAGKTTVARVTADSLSASVHLHADDFWHYIRQGRVAPYLPEAHQQNQTVMDVIAQAAFCYAAGGYQVVCDGIVGPWFIGVLSGSDPAATPPVHRYRCLRTTCIRCWEGHRLSLRSLLRDQLAHGALPLSCRRSRAGLRHVRLPQPRGLLV